VEDEVVLELERDDDSEVLDDEDNVLVGVVELEVKLDVAVLLLGKVAT